MCWLKIIVKKYGRLFSIAALFCLGYCQSQESQPSIKTGVFCPDPGQIENGFREPDSNLRLLPHRTVLHIVCDEGYKLMGIGKMVCGERSQWEPPVKPQCRKEIMCSIPPNFNNTVLEINSWASGLTTTDKSADFDGYPSKPSYPEGSIATYSCAFDYRSVEGNTAEQKICRMGKWIGQNLHCSRSVCDPPDLKQGYIIEGTSSGQIWAPAIDSKVSYPVGSVVMHKCPHGYSLDNTVPVRHECMLGGLWTPPIVDRCHRIKVGCPNLDRIPHAKVALASPNANLVPLVHSDSGDQTDVSFGSGIIYPEDTVLEFVCSEGYRPKACQRLRTVCSEGKWISRVDPVCVLSDGCGRPPMIPYGMPSSSQVSYPVGSKVVYLCLPGFQMVSEGSPELTCNPNGCWTPAKTPQCIMDDAYASGLGLGTRIKGLGGSGLSSNDDNDWDLLDTRTVSMVTAGTVMGILFIVLILVLLQRRGLHIGVCLRGNNGRLARASRRRPSVSSAAAAAITRGREVAGQAYDPDRVALIAFADGVQVVLPTYEEAIRQSDPAMFENYAGIHRGGGGSRWHRSGATAGGFMASLPMLRRTRLHTAPTVRDNSTDTGSGDVPSRNIGGHNLLIMGEGMGSTDTMTPSEVSTAVTADTISSNASCVSQAPSCRAMCGSLASFDTSSVLNTDGVPLLEDPEEEILSACDSDGISYHSATTSNGGQNCNLSVTPAPT